MTAENNGDKKNGKLPFSLSEKFTRWAYRGAALAGLTAALAYESAYSPLQTKVFQSAADGTAFAQMREMGPEAVAPAVGPFDERFGYTETLKFRKNLTPQFDFTGKTAWLDREIMGIQLTPIYDEKMQAGLRISDDTGKPVFSFPMPREVYPAFADIPELVVKSLLFVENRDLLSQHADTQNPAIEWERFVNATIGYSLKKVYIPYNGQSGGGSTLATQLEKFKHYPDGRTNSAGEKFSQMLTASVRSYMKGANTVQHRRQIVLEYLNAMPLASYPGFGEVNGYGDGLIWFGADFKETNRLLAKPESAMNDDELKVAAKAYRQTLALIMAVKKPTTFLVKERKQLEARINRFLPELVKAGIITQRMKDAVLSESLEFSDPSKFTRVRATADQKSSQALQIDLLKRFDVRDLYDLNRLDLTAKTTINGEADRAVAKIFRDLKDPEKAKAAGIVGHQKLPANGTQYVTYALTLLERLPDGNNALRVQTDNFDGPLNFNESIKAELGSSAKLRETADYLVCVNFFRSMFGGMTPEQLRALPFKDPISRWGIEYLANPDTDKSLDAMVDAALERTYSASTGEVFFTGGGVHTFSNFRREDNGRVVTVKQALHGSINLPFIRLMRDIVAFTQAHDMKIDLDIYENPESPMRAELLRKFADAEGRTFMWEFWGEQKGKTPEQTADFMAKKTLSAGSKIFSPPKRLAVVYRAVFPGAPVEEMEAFIKRHCQKCSPKLDYQELYDKHAPGKFDLNDQGYIANLDPLELWLAQYRTKNPDAKWEQAVEASGAARLFSYKWLLNPGNLTARKMRAQNLRIRTVLGNAAYVHIHARWKQLAYPFSALVPSYATALGASGDTPYALAQFVGIIQNDGILKEPIRFSDVHFAEGTPYAIKARAKIEPGKRVLPPEITRALRREMQGVVEHGTARRVFQSVKLSDGRILPVGAKTGTGDNRKETYARGGGVTSSVAVSRTATFVFVIDDRFYGCLTAYVAGEKADKYEFTSGLTAQIFITVIPAILPVLDRAYGVAPPASNANAAPVKEVPKAPAPPKPAA